MLNYRVEKISSLGMFRGKLLTKPEERLSRRLVEIFKLPTLFSLLETFRGRK
jgi:hypothetical protein